MIITQNKWDARISTANSTPSDFILNRIINLNKFLQVGGVSKKSRFVGMKVDNFDRNLLPKPGDYYAVEGLKLKGRGPWRNAICPFHSDTHPSLRIRIETGAFACMACGAHGGDVLAYHQQRHGLTFKQAAQQLGAWKGGVA